MAWFVYILSCADGTLYTGTTTDVERRVMEHNGGGAVGKGAKYTKARRPVRLAYHESVPNRSTAQIREAAVKKLTRQAKVQLIDSKVKSK